MGSEARKIPNLPGYVEQRPIRLESEIERVTGGIQYWDKKPYKGYIHRAIDSIRETLPKKDLAREQATFQKWLGLFDGDKEKALVAMSLGEAIDSGKRKLTTQDFVYCEDSEIVADFWKSI